jgi:WD40 repeat protein
MEHEIASGAWACAWSHDGSVLAVPRRSAVDIDLFDSRNWKIRQTLCTTYTQNSRIVSEVARLCFDRNDNLYLAAFNDWHEEEGGMLTANEYSPRLWWRVGNPWSPKPLPVGSCFQSWEAPHPHPIMAYDLAVSAAAQETRVAIAYWACESQILTMRKRSGEAPYVDRAFNFRSGRWVKLTPDGKQLVTFQGERVSAYDPAKGEEPKERIPAQLSVFRVLDDRVELVRSRAVERPPYGVDLVVPQFLDVSNNGQLAASCGKRAAEVVRIPSCDPILRIPHNEMAVTGITFSPDSRLLALANRERKEVLFYQIPK